MHEVQIEQQYRQRRCYVGVVQGGEEEEGREERDIQGAVLSQQPVLFSGTSSRVRPINNRQKTRETEQTQAPQRDQAASDDRRESIGKEVKTRRCRDLGIPDIEMASAIVLCLTDVENFILSREIRIDSLPSRLATYEVGFWDGVVYGFEPGEQRECFGCKGRQHVLSGAVDELGLCQSWEARKKMRVL